MENIEQFKELLSVPSKTYYEHMMVDYLMGVIKEIPNVTVYKDSEGNIYASKGDAEYKPMFVAHTDTVHAIEPELIIEEFYTPKPYTFGRSFDDTVYKALRAVTPSGLPTGIGGDDKCGIFICLELLKQLDNVKVGLFTAEEVGCIGSSQCDLNFLTDVGYIVQFDAPSTHLITEYCSGVQLFERDSDFFNKAIPVIENAMGTKMELQSHPYTDVSVLKKKTDVSCINISCGYYNMHSKSEFVVISDVEKSIQAGLSLAKELGNEKYTFEYKPTTYTYQRDLFNDKAPWDEDHALDTILNDMVSDYYEDESTLVIMEEEDGAYLYNEENEQGFFVSKEDIKQLASWIMDTKHITY